jgi:hypothetical protein
MGVPKLLGRDSVLFPSNNMNNGSFLKEREEWHFLSLLLFGGTGARTQDLILTRESFYH